MNSFMLDGPSLGAWVELGLRNKVVEPINHGVPCVRKNAGLPPASIDVLLLFG